MHKSQAYSDRLAAARAKAVQLAADHFDRLGEPYTGRHQAIGIVGPELARLSEHPDYAPYRVHSVNNTLRAADEVRMRHASKGAAK